jgi:hypothetical protein
VIVFGVTILTVYFFPVYSDEIQVRFWLSRLFYDFPEKISGSPACTSTFFLPIPTTMYLPGAINWVTHGMLQSIPSLRMAGIVIPGLWCSGLAVYLSRRAKAAAIVNGAQLPRGLLSVYVTGFFIALFSIGVFPIFLATNRNEQLMLPCVVLLLAIFIASSRSAFKANLLQRFGLVALYFIAVSLILYGHAKGLFFTPFFLIVAWRLFTSFKSRIPLILGLLVLFTHLVTGVSDL